jgi:hypothetical protein
MIEHLPAATHRREMLFPFQVRQRSATVMVTVMVPIVIASGGGDHNPGRFIENQLARAVLVPIVEVEHVVERSGNGIERAARLNALT